MDGCDSTSRAIRGGRHRIYERSWDIVSFYNNIAAFSFLLSEPPYANGGIFVQ